MADAMLQDAPCGFLCLDDDGTVTYGNDTLHSMLKVEPGTLVGRHVDTILTPGARIFYQTHVFPLLRGNETLRELYMSLRAGDGGSVPVLLNASRRDADGTAINVWVVVPMRRRYEFEDQLQTARREAERANEAKSRLLSIVSHDIRSPLNAMSLGLELLVSEAAGPLTSQQREVVERITRAGTRATRLVDDLLDYARLKSTDKALRLEPISLDSAFAEVHAIFARQMERYHLRLNVEPCPDVSVMANRQRLQQVMVNLLENAIKHTEEGGTVTVSCRAEKDRADITVSDTGCGIPEDRLDDIFEPFVQLPARRIRGEGGVGLGLAISRDFVEAMGGRIRVQSGASGGTAFTVVLPRSAGPDPSSERRGRDSNP